MRMKTRVDPIPIPERRKTDLITLLLPSKSLMLICFARNRCIPLDSPRAEIAMKIVAKEITAEAVPITEVGAIFDKINQYRYPENSMLIASIYKYAAPVLILSLLILVPIGLTSYR